MFSFTTFPSLSLRKRRRARIFQIRALIIISIQFSRYIKSNSYLVREIRKCKHLLITGILQIPFQSSNPKLFCASAFAWFWTPVASFLHYFRGDGEIRTHDPLLARQVLSQLSYTPINFGAHLLSHFVSKAVPSAVQGLTIVFGMRTGVSPGRISTKNYCCKVYLNNKTVQPTSLLFPLERR